jgi:hypothetical protein
MILREAYQRREHDPDRDPAGGVGFLKRSCSNKKIEWM